MKKPNDVARILAGGIMGYIYEEAGEEAAKKCKRIDLYKMILSQLSAETETEADDLDATPTALTATHGTVFPLDTP